MYSPSLSTHRFIRVLHCSKQCYSSSTPRPFSSCAGFAFTTSTDENGLPLVHFPLWGTETFHRVPNPRIWRMFKYWNAFTGKKLLDRKGVVSWGIVLIQDPYVVLPEIRPLLPQDLSHCLSDNTHHVCNHSHTQMSIFAKNSTDFLNVLLSFRSQSVTWMLIIFHFLPTLTKFLCHSSTRERDIKLSPYTSFNNLMGFFFISQEISD